MEDKNLCGKTRGVNDPYEIWVSYDGTWEWRVLKKYQKPSLEAKNQYARWFCAVRTPMTYGDYDMGDVYMREIIRYANKQEFKKEAIEQWKEYR